MRDNVLCMHASLSHKHILYSEQPQVLAVQPAFHIQANRLLHRQWAATCGGSVNKHTALPLTVGAEQNRSEITKAKKNMTTEKSNNRALREWSFGRRAGGRRRFWEHVGELSGERSKQPTALLGRGERIYLRHR